MEVELQADVKRAQEMHQFISDTIAGPYPSAPRSLMFGCFMAMCMSHHEAILTLVCHDRLTGSALALLRPLVESCYRGVFVGFIATDAEVEQVRNGTITYPRFNDLASRLDAELKTTALFSEFGGRVWSMLNDYTHTGTIQLASRFDRRGMMGAYYSTAQLRDLVVQGTAILARIAIPYLGSLRSSQAARAVSDEYIRLYPLTPLP